MQGGLNLELNMADACQIEDHGPRVAKKLSLKGLVYQIANAQHGLNFY